MTLCSNVANQLEGMRKQIVKCHSGVNETVAKMKPEWQELETENTKSDAQIAATRS